MKIVKKCYSSGIPLLDFIKYFDIILRKPIFTGYESDLYIMAGSTFGNLFRITTWGESHGAAIGVVVDGCPAGLILCSEDIQKYLNRRKPGQTQYTTQRKEADEVEILSGIF